MRAGMILPAWQAAATGAAGMHAAARGTAVTVCTATCAVITACSSATTGGTTRSSGTPLTPQRAIALAAHGRKADHSRLPSRPYQI